MTHLAVQATGIKTNFVDSVARVAAYSASDLLCYRGLEGSPLAARQEKIWQPILAWAAARHHISLAVTHDLAPIDQDPQQLKKVAKVVGGLDPYQLATLAEVTSLSGSVIVALALLDNEIDEAGAWEAGALDENFQIESWGEDTEALVALAAKRRALAAAVQFEQMARDDG